VRQSRRRVRHARASRVQPVCQSAAAIGRVGDRPGQRLRHALSRRSLVDRPRTVPAGPDCAGRALERPAGLAAHHLRAHDPGCNGNPTTQHKSQWVPNAGLLYKLTPLLSLYASATSGFQADEVLGKNGQPLLPSHSRQLETGAKLMLFDQRAMLTVAAYRIMLDHSTDLS